MTFSGSTATPGRQPASILELDLDACSRSYGVSPCTADLALRNIAIRTEEFENAVWNSGRSAVTADTTANPVNGSVTADTWLEEAFTGTHL